MLAGREAPPLRIARLRAEGRLLEIGSDDLALTPGEAASLLRDAGVVLGEDDVVALHRQTEGWAAGLYLAALYLREGHPLASAAVSFGGDDRLVSEYMESEFLALVSRRQRAFLARTAALKRMSGPLCDAVLEEPGSAAVLADLARSNLLLMPLDRRGEWYRYHHLFRDMLLAQLHRREPELVPVLRHRAAEWCLRNGLPEEALEYSMAAGDVDMTAGLVEMLSVRTYWQGRVSTAQRWFRWLEDQGGIEGHPMAAVLASILSVRFQEILRRLTMIDEQFIEGEARLGLSLAGTSALDSKTAALLRVGVSVATGSSAACLHWSISRAMAAGATEDEIADVLLAIAPVAGLGRVTAAAPDVAIALGYDVAAALEELDGP